MEMFPENRLGYLRVTPPLADFPARVKASKIAYFHKGGDAETLIGLDGDIQLHVRETAVEILEQLENIHPNML